MQHENLIKTTCLLTFCFQMYTCMHLKFILSKNRLQKRNIWRLKPCHGSLHGQYHENHKHVNPKTNIAHRALFKTERLRLYLTSFYFSILSLKLGFKSRRFVLTLGG